MPERTNKQYDAELESLRNRVLQMGGVVEQQLTMATEALNASTLKPEIFNAVVSREAEVNQTEMEIDEVCNHILARRQPTAIDLRSVLAAIKMIRDLERIGDEAEKIARMGLKIIEAGHHFMPAVDLQPIARKAVAMLRKVLDSYARVNVTSAVEVVRADIEVDQEFKLILHQLIKSMTDDGRSIERSIDILFVAKAIERVGDHSKNMSEHVVYYAKGHDVRHMSPDVVEKRLRDDA